MHISLLFLTNALTLKRGGISSKNGRMCAHDSSLSPRPYPIFASQLGSVFLGFAEPRATFFILLVCFTTIVSQRGASLRASQEI